MDLSFTVMYNFYTLPVSTGRLIYVEYTRVYRCIHVYYTYIIRPVFTGIVLLERKQKVMARQHFCRGIYNIHHPHTDHTESNMSRPISI